MNTQLISLFINSPLNFGNLFLGPINFIIVLKKLRKVILGLLQAILMYKQQNKAPVYVINKIAGEKLFYEI